MRDFVRIRRFLTKSVTIRMANALVSSRIDYCNSLLKGCYDQDLLRLQGSRILYAVLLHVLCGSPISLPTLLICIDLAPCPSTY